jgi:hypothetical protein
MDAQLQAARNDPRQLAMDLHKLAYSIDEAARLSGLSRAFIYAEWHAGRGPKRIKAGKRTLIMADALRAWLRALEERPGA